jgi:hypothetical protein
MEKQIEIERLVEEKKEGRRRRDLVLVEIPSTAFSES